MLSAQAWQASKTARQYTTAKIIIITTTTVLQPFVRDYPGEPVPEEKRNAKKQHCILFDISPCTKQKPVTNNMLM